MLCATSIAYVQLLLYQLRSVKSCNPYVQLLLYQLRSVKSCNPYVQLLLYQLRSVKSCNPYVQLLLYQLRSVKSCNLYIQLLLYLLLLQTSGSTDSYFLERKYVNTSVQDSLRHKATPTMKLHKLALFSYTSDMIIIDNA